MTVSYIILDGSVVLNFDNQTQTVYASEGNYEKVIECIKNNELDLIPEILDSMTPLINELSQSEFEVVDETVLVDGKAIPEVLNKRILNHMLEGLPYEPLVNFARKLFKNPSLNSRKMLYDFLEHNGHPITTEGNFIAYRGVSEDFKDIHTGKFDNSVGSVCEMPRDEVDDNPNNTCSAGLHVACFDYAKDFGRRTVEVEVDPSDVVCVPTDYNGTKMRVCRFKVVGECKNMNENFIYNNKTEENEELKEDIEELRNRLAHLYEMQYSCYDDKMLEFIENEIVVIEAELDYLTSK